MAVLLPFAVQFIHSFKYHEHICNENDIHVDTHQLKCGVFHFKINQNAIDFDAEVSITENTSLNTKIITSEAQLASILLTHKSSRAPPVLLF